ncbi:OLC1v1000723C1 [Oldenlandia corymbosa var. corymbosa]|uniref:OLC1v1000723C1 n=1 Tax=Oldenlandia corymbosa var. corymbosa TaxID=529605 RepID=A0AAV1D6B3_OLDCO|nr:OLC1v1000723C1 [Oldenlandia corymbosa var. corymbosa]
MVTKEAENQIVTKNPKNPRIGSGEKEATQVKHKKLESSGLTEKEKALIPIDVVHDDSIPRELEKKVTLEKDVAGKKQIADCGKGNGCQNWFDILAEDSADDEELNILADQLVVVMPDQQVAAVAATSPTIASSSLVVNGSKLLLFATVHHSTVVDCRRETGRATEGHEIPQLSQSPSNLQRNPIDAPVSAQIFPIFSNAEQRLPSPSDKSITVLNSYFHSLDVENLESKSMQPYSTPSNPEHVSSPNNSSSSAPQIDPEAKLKSNSTHSNNEDSFSTLNPAAPEFSYSPRPQEPLLEVLLLISDPIVAEKPNQFLSKDDMEFVKNTEPINKIYLIEDIQSEGGLNHASNDFDEDDFDMEYALEQESLYSEISTPTYHKHSKKAKSKKRVQVRRFALLNKNSALHKD